MNAEIETPVTEPMGTSEATPDPTDHTAIAEAQDDAPETAEARGEAAKYRRRLRDAEAERDGLLTQLEGMRRAEVERLVDAQRVYTMKPAALWAAGTDLAGLLTAEGTVDAEKVTAAIAAAAETLGSPRVPSAPSAYGTQGRVGTSIYQAEPAPSWGSVLRG